MAVPSTEAAPIGRPVIVGGLGMFLLIGAAGALYGPVLPSLVRAFDLTEADAGLLLTAHFIGAVVAISGSALIQRRLPTRAPLLAAAALLVAGCATVASVPNWKLVLIGAGAIGLSYGGLGVGFNTLFAQGFGSRSTAMINILNAAFGFGAILGPLLVAAIGPARYQASFAAVGGLALLALPALLVVPDRRSPPGDAQAMSADRRAAAGATWFVLGTFLALYLLYTGIEQGVGGWEATHLISLGHSAAAAATFTALYWASLTAGRLLAASLGGRVSPERILTGALAAAVGALALAHVPPLAPMAYMLAGVAAGPIYPTGLVWLVRVLPRVRSAIPMAMISASVGAAVLPAGIGRFVTAFGAQVIPTALAVITLACLAVLLVLRRAARSRDEREALTS